MKRAILYTFLLAGLSQVGCKKQLDLLPTDAIDITKAFQNVNDLEQGLLGAYSTNDQTNKIYLGSILADETKLSDENRGQGQFEFKWQYSSGDGGVTDAYRRSYTMIDRIHRVQVGATNVTPADQAETNRMARIVAELKALKGIAYYESLINFMPPGYDPDALGIALVSESCLTCTPARNTVGEVASEIQSLLAAARAEVNIPNAPTNPIRLSKSAIAAYQARVALLKQDYPAAVTFATDAINLSGKTLATPAEFEAFWRDENESESIFSYRNQRTPRLLWTDTNGDVFFEPSQKLKNQYDRNTDSRFSIYSGSAGSDTSIVIKYKGSSAGASVNDLKIIRVAELYLIRAEANARQNQIGLAANDINAIGAARITGYTPIAFAGQPQAIAAVMNERFKELCFEGFRYYDLKRNGLDITRLNSDVQSTQWLNLPATDYRYTLPIPQDALNANENTVQNPGY